MSSSAWDKMKYFLGFSGDEEESNHTSISNEKKKEEVEKRASQVIEHYQKLDEKKESNYSNSGEVSLNKYDVFTFRPRSFNDAVVVVDNLKELRPVVLNLEEVDTANARKIFDFCSGALYALDGQIQRISKGVFLLVPPTVEIKGNIKDDEEEVEEE